jgi:hypothetical protein
VFEPDNYRRLAVSVIERAIKDVEGTGCTEDERESARRFLDGSAMLFHWCSVAALDAHRVITYASGLPRPPRRAR